MTRYGQGSRTITIKSMLMDGIFAAITTPFSSDEQLYFRKIEANMAHYSRSPLAGMLVLGSTGEAVMLNDAESADVLRCAAEATTPEKVLIAGVGRESVRATLALAELAARFQYDAVLVRPPSYYVRQMSAQAVLNYFRMVADHSPLPLLLYNIPQSVPYSIPVEVVAELAWHPNIIGIKDSSGSVDRIKAQVDATKTTPGRAVTVTTVLEAVTGRMLTQKPETGASFVSAGKSAGVTDLAATPSMKPLKTRTKEIGFQVLCGSGSAALASLQAGASGAILAFAACAPQACTEIYLAWKDHDLKLAEEKQQRIAAANERIVGEMGIAALKYACDFNGYFGGKARAPFLDLTAEEKVKIEETLALIRN